MPQGLQCWDASGNLILDFTDSITRVVEVRSVTAGSSGSIQLPEGRPFWHTVVNAGPNSLNSTYAPNISVNGSNLLSYSPGQSVPGSVVPDVTLLVGVY